MLHPPPCAMKLLTLFFTALAMIGSAAEPTAKMETAIVGGGCFWCTEATYKLIPGVKKITSGYAAGKTQNPTYEEICEGDSGHAEVVKVDFDPTAVSYRKILDLFFEMHDPTSVTKEETYKHGKLLPKGTPYQGNDYGTQYRSIIITQNDEQKKHAEAAKADAQKNWKDPIATEITGPVTFYPAEDYHQDFAKRNPNQGYVQGVVKPKEAKFRHKLEERGEKIKE
jgi:peptide-methionine (S)-S-oxide reductase